MVLAVADASNVTVWLFPLLRDGLALEPVAMGEPDDSAYSMDDNGRGLTISEANWETFKLPQLLR